MRCGERLLLARRWHTARALRRLTVGREVWSNSGDDYYPIWEDVTRAPEKIRAGQDWGEAPRRHATQKALLLGIDPGDGSFERSVDELESLCATAGAQVVGQVVQRRDTPDQATYLGSGKAQEAAEQVQELEADLAIVNAELAPTQQRNLSRVLGVTVIDRTQLILDIFAQRARTHEGKLQVELAQLNYLLPRLAGMWTHLERQAGGIGTRGPGESQLESDRRHISRRIQTLKQALKDVARHRAARVPRDSGCPFPCAGGLWQRRKVAAEHDHRCPCRR